MRDRLKWLRFSLSLLLSLHVKNKNKNLCKGHATLFQISQKLCVSQPSSRSSASTCDATLDYSYKVYVIVVFFSFLTCRRTFASSMNSRNFASFCTSRPDLHSGCFLTGSFPNTLFSWISMWSKELKKKAIQGQERMGVFGGKPRVWDETSSFSQWLITLCLWWGELGKNRDGGKHCQIAFRAAETSPKSYVLPRLQKSELESFD